MEKIEKRCKKYNTLTKKALKEIKISVPKNSALYPIAMDFLQMAKSYLKDGEYYEKDDLGIALASYSYAHAWLDAGARMGLFNVKNNYKLFTLYK